MKYIDLHIHLDGSLPPETIVKLAELSGYRLPADSPEALRPYLTVGAGCTDLNEYLRKFGIPLKVLQRADCLELAAYDLLRALSAQGVIYAEPRFAPGSHCARGLTQGGQLSHPFLHPSHSLQFPEPLRVKGRIPGGVSGAMSALRRVRAGLFTLDGAHTLEEVQAAADAGLPRSSIKSSCAS